MRHDSTAEAIPPERELERAMELYGAHREELESKYLGWHVVFNLRTGEYVVHRDILEIGKLADSTFGFKDRTVQMGIGFEYRV